MVANLAEAPSEAAAPNPPPLRFWTIAAFCIGSIGPTAILTLLASGTLNFYLNQVIGLDPLTVGAGITASLVIDAVIDPLIAQWSDHMRSPIGRRHPLLYASAALAPVAGLIFWHLPHLAPTLGFLVFVFLCLAATRITSSAYEIATLAMVPEFAPGYNQRTWFIAFLTLTGLIAGAALALVFNLVFVRQDANHPLGLLNRSAYESFSVLCAAIAVVTMLIGAIGTQGRAKYFHAPSARSASFAAQAEQLKGLFSNVSLLVVLASSLLLTAALSVLAGMSLYLYTYFWNLSPQQFGLIGPFTAVAGLLAVPAAPLLSGKFGKKPAMLATLLIGLFTTWAPLVLKLVGLMPTNPTLVVTILALDAAIGGGLALTGVIIRGSMISDIVEDHAAKAGHRAEGLVFAAQGLSPKIAGGVGIIIVGALLNWVHFPTHAVKGSVSPIVMNHLVLLYLPVVASLTTLAIVALLFYRIDQSTHELNLERLRQAGMAGATSTGARGANASAVGSRASASPEL